MNIETNQRIPSNELCKRLVEEFGYPEHGANMVAEKVHAMTNEVYAEFEKWWKDGDIAPFECNGYSIETLVQSYGLNPVAAFLTMDWLVREPEKAAAAIRQGYDKVQFHVS